ncbi:MAG: methenyltetrahydromethanopterin cyclohydrolase, partial [Candidatus Bathyarchaeia archaeon]
DWELQIQGFPVIGSGPARALALNRRMPAAVASKRDAYEEAGYVINSPPEIYEKIGYRDFSDVAVIALESPVLPTNETLQGIAEQCGVEPRRLYAIVAPTSSIVGSVQVAARVLEVGIHKLGLLGFDLKKIVSGSAYSAIAPVHPDSDEAMGRTNDMIWYGGVTFYTVECDDEDVRRIISRIPAEASKDYDKGFAEIFRGARHGFYDVDLGSFAPAIVTINNARTGSTFTAGRVNPEALRRMLIS